MNLTRTNNVKKMNGALRRLAMAAMMLLAASPAWATEYVFITNSGFISVNGNGQVEYTTTFSRSCIWTCLNTSSNPSDLQSNANGWLYTYVGSTQYWLVGSTTNGQALSAQDTKPANARWRSNGDLLWRDGNNYYVYLDGSTWMSSRSNYNSHIEANRPSVIAVTTNDNDAVLSVPTISPSSATLDYNEYETFTASATLTPAYTTYSYNDGTAHTYYYYNSTMSGTAPGSTTAGITYSWTLTGSANTYLSPTSGSGSSITITHSTQAMSDVSSTLSVTATGGGDSKSSTSNATITASAPKTNPTSLSITSGSTMTMYVGQTGTITYSLADGCPCYNNVTFASADNATASVNGSGVVTGVATGTTTITVTAYKTNGTTTSDLTKTVSVTVKDKVATPDITFTPDISDITQATLNISCATPGTTIYYKIGSGSYNEYSGTPIVHENEVVTAYAVKTSNPGNLWDQSDEATATYISCTTAKPVFSYTTANQRATVTITAEDGATVYYTVNGNDPNENSTHTSTLPVTISNLTNGTIVKAYAKNGQCQASDIDSVTLVITGADGSTVTIDDREDHRWTYYSDPDCPIRSLSPSDVKITYYGDGIVMTGNADYTASSTDFVKPGQTNYTGGAKVNVGGENENTFVYYKTLERGDATQTAWTYSSSSQSSAASRCPYTTIPNPFQVRPTYGARGDTDANDFTGWRGFQCWRLKSVSGGAVYSAASGGKALSTGAVINGETQIYFAPNSEYGMEVELEAVWARAYLIKGNNNTTSVLSQNVGVERNFVILTSNGQTYKFNGTSGRLINNLTYPVTISCYYPSGEAPDYTNSTVRGNDNNITLLADTKFENVGFYSMSSYTLTADGHNLIVGRGCYNTVGTVRGLSGNTSGTVEYTIRLEYGTYNTFTMIDGTTHTHSGTVSAKTIFGCDYDRAKEDNSKLSIAANSTVYGASSYQTFSSNTNRNNLTYDWLIKSGTVQGSKDVADGAAANCIYMGNSGNANNNDGNQYQGKRRLVMEGGEVCNISGGLNNYGNNYANYIVNDGWAVQICIKGGTVRGAIFGAAAFAGASGDRLFIFTGGTINGWVAGGANGTQNTGGELYGSTAMYMGGNTVIGSSTGGTHVGGYNATYGTNGADGGHVFGAGCGILPRNGNFQNGTVGRVDNSTIVVADNAHIWRDVHGGGNYGWVRDNGSTGIYIAGGTIGGIDGYGNVFGGSNNQQGQEVGITVKGGDVKGGVYGGSHSWGTINDNVTMNISGGTVEGGVYGGGYGTNSNSCDVEETVDITMTGGTVLTGIYGGGNVNSKINGKTTVNVDGGTVGASNAPASVYGGGLGAATRAKGDVEVNIGSIDGSGNTSGSAVIYGDVYGGSAKGVTNCNDGGTEYATGTKTDVTLNGGTINGSLYGGGHGIENAVANVWGPVTVVVNGGSVKETAVNGSGSVYGCNNVNGAPQSTVDVDIYGTDPQPASGFALANVYGGGNQADYSSTPDVTVHATNCGSGKVSIGNVYGGGNAAAVSATNVLIYGGDSIGAVYAGGNGYGKDSTFRMATDATANIHGGKIGRIFPGNNSGGTVTNTPVVNIDTRTLEDGVAHCPLNVGAVFHGGNRASSAQATVNILCTGQATEGIDTLFGGANNAYIMGNASLSVSNGNIRKAIFGGNNAGGAVKGSVSVEVLAPTASEGCPAPATWPSVFGGGYGAATRVWGNVTVNIGDSTTTSNPPTVTATFEGGAVYGGSALGQVGLANGSSTTRVNINNATINGSVYGGGLGMKEYSGDFDGGSYVVSDSLAALINGAVMVNIGNKTRAASDNAVNITGYVYGGNNLCGYATGNTTVHIWRTAHNDNNTAPSQTDVSPEVEDIPDLDLLSTEPEAFALQAVYGGGNMANYETSGKTAKVYVHGCSNTIRFLYGGGNAANTPANYVEIDGGRFYMIFGGGNGEVSTLPGADVVEGDAETLVKGGVYNAIFGGSNTKGSIAGRMNLRVEPDPAGCGLEVIGNLYGGGNKAPSRGGDLKVKCGDVVLGNVYGGANMADITGDVSLTIEGGDYGKVFGGSKGDRLALGEGHVDKTAAIAGSVTLNLYGGTIVDAFGGSDQNGSISGTILLNVLDKEDSECPLRVTNIYGAGNVTAYRPTDNTISSPIVNVMHINNDGNGVTGNVFGGGLGETAEVRANPIVNIGYVNSTMSSLKPGGYENPTGFPKAIVGGNVYGGGSLASVVGSTTVNVVEESGDLLHTSIGGDVFGAGAGRANSMADRELARVSGNTLVDIRGGHIHGSVYGGGELASVGPTWDDIKANYKYYPIVNYSTKVADSGNAKVLVSGGLIGDLDALIGSAAGQRHMGHTLNYKGYVYGAGKGMVNDNDYLPKFAYVDSTYVEISGGRIGGSLFGGGENGHVRFSTFVKVSDGTVGRELADDDGIAAALKSACPTTWRDSIEHREINGQGAQEIYFGNVYGGGRGIEAYEHESTPTYSRSAGHVFCNTNVLITAGRVTHNVYGGGSLASVGIKDSVNTGTATVTITGGIIGYDDGKTTFTNTGAYSYDGTAYDNLIPANKQKVKDFYLRAGINEGRVYGSGRGQVSNDSDLQEQYRDLAFVKNTVVVISDTAQVRGSVFGGGANGHVRYNTDVTLTGTTSEAAAHRGKPFVGVPLMNLPDWGDDTWAMNASDGYISHDVLTAGDSSVKYYATEEIGQTNATFNGAHLHERWIAADGEMPVVYRGNVYGGGRGISPTATVGTGISTYHYSATAGRVYGNVDLKLNGGTVFHDVYGGGSLASVGNAVASIDGADAIGLWGNHFTKANGYIDSIANHAAAGHSPALVRSERDYRVGDPITGTGNVKVTLNGTVIGTDGIGNGDLFGGGRGIAGAVDVDVTHLAFVTNTYLYIKSGTAKGSAFGGGANGHVSQNTLVEMTGGKVGERLPLAERKVDEKTGHGYRVYRGNLYGGGRGVDPLSDGAHLSKTAGRVYGNTRVHVAGGQVYHSVFGGGSLASVGTYAERTFDGSRRHLYIQGTGQAVVTIDSAAVIGNAAADLESTFSNSAADVVTVKSLLHLVDNDWKDLNASQIDTKWNGLTAAKKQSYFIELNYHFMGSNSGMVFGSGRGVGALGTGGMNTDYADAAFTRNTIVTVKDGAGAKRPVIVGSVFGGGENGHVKHDTYVHIHGGNIGGIPLHDTVFKPGQNTQNGISDPNYSGFSFSDSADLVLSLEYEDSENNFGHGPAVYRGNVYGGGRGVDHDDSEDPETGYSATAGRVYGDVEVLVDSGVIFHHVFGGGSLASVGTYNYDGTGRPISVQPIYEYRLEPYSAGHTEFSDTREDGKYATRRLGFPFDGSEPDTLYVLTIDAAGDIAVKVTGGQVGRVGVNEGSVFGGGRGIAGDNNQTVTHLAYCNSSTVTIEDGADIRGNVFGGGANGHVLTNTSVTMTGGTVGYPLTPQERTITQYGEATKQVFHGNVYGGGRGVDPIQSSAGESEFSYTAGRVYGNASVNISGGTVAHNVYGGGSLATVGTIFYKTAANDAANNGLGSSLKPTDYDPDGAMVDTTGIVSVTIGGTAEIGTDGMNNGSVYGSCRGVSGYDYSNRAYVYRTTVTINAGTAGKPYIRGSVFGSGENGHVEKTTAVYIKGGTIGRDISGIFTAIDAGTGDYVGFTDAQKAAEKKKYDYMGNVYGGGRGVDSYLDEHSHSQYSYSAGYVRNSASVKVSDGTIHRNVYGGGSMGLVGQYGIYGDFDFFCVSGNESTDSAIWVVRDGGQVGDDNFWLDNGGLATVTVVGGTVGSANNVANGYGGNVFGSSRGRANDATNSDFMPDGTTPISSYNFGAMAYVTRAVVTIDTDAYVLGSVYGGGENGHVDWGGTLVNILGGTIDGNVFAGGMGSTSSPTAGIIDGPATVNIGRDNNGTYEGNATIGGCVFGGNDTWGSPLGDMTVNIYSTAHPSGTAVGDAGYALKGVYGGGNMASVLTGWRAIDSKDGNAAHVLDSLYITERIKDNASSPKGYRVWPATTTRRSYVTVYGCLNTIDSVYGGGNAADTHEDTVIIHGGRIGCVFAGGNGSGATNPGADVGNSKTVYSASEAPLVHNGGAAATVYGGTVGNVFAGSNAKGAILGTPSVTVNKSGSCDMHITNVYGGGNMANGMAGNVSIGCTGGASEGIANVFGGANNANVTGNITLDITGGRIGSVYGGNNSGGTVDGNITINATWSGSCANNSLDYVYGGGYGDATRTTGHVTVNINGATVSHDVYGGSALGQVNSDANDTVTVNILSGTVSGNVFGGGLGQEGAGNSAKGQVNGYVIVNIGRDNNGTYEGTATLGGMVFGGNNTNGSPQNDIEVNVYKTNHPAGSAYPNVNTVMALAEPDNLLTSADITALGHADNTFALKAVYGGGFKAPYTPAGSNKTKVTVYGCSENTIKYVYGGGCAADSRETEVVIEGGRIYQVYAGGNGSDDEVSPNPGANIVNNAQVTVKGGLIDAVFGGSNTLGVVRGVATVNFEETGCEQVVNESFGGGNQAPGGNAVVTIPCEIPGLKDVYGGANAADIGTEADWNNDIKHNIVLNILGSTITNVFGGNKSAGVIYGDVTVNVHGGTITNVFGGSNEGGDIRGAITVNIDDTSTLCPLSVDYVYGGGNEVAYNPAAEYKMGPVVNLINGTVNNDVFGGGYGTTAMVTANPQVNVGGSTDGTNQFSVLGCVYGGGSAAPVTGSTFVKVGSADSHPTTIGTSADAITPPGVPTGNGDIFGGGLGSTAIVDGNTAVWVFGPKTTVYHNIYGGGSAGMVMGSTDVQIGADAALSIAMPLITLGNDGKATITCATEGVTIHYTLGDSPATPSETVGTAYTEPVTVPAGQTLKAVAYRSGYTTSAINTLAPLAAPRITSTGTKAAINGTAGATFYYTTNGSEPTTSSTLYEDSISVSCGTVVKAIAVKSGYTTSPAGHSTVQKPTIKIEGGTATLTCQTKGATMYYTIGDSPSDPSACSGTAYSGTPVSVPAGQTIKVIASLAGLAPSAVATATRTAEP